MGRRKLEEVKSWDDVPEFASEAEEAEFWGTHGLSALALSQMEVVDSATLQPFAEARDAAAKNRPRTPGKPKKSRVA